MTSNPHDAFFKAVFGEPEHARGALQAICPAPLAAALDWSTLERCPGSFVDAALLERHTDLLFSTTWRSGGDALVYLLFEHQSTPDFFMGYRLLRYQVRIWESWCAAHPDAKALPMIIPCVLYHGATQWSAPRTFDALLDVPADARASVAEYLVRFSYLLDDLSQVTDAELRARAMTALGKLVHGCLKNGRSRTNLVTLLASGWLDVLRDVVRAARGLDALELVMRYMFQVAEHVDSQELYALLEREIGPEAKDMTVTFAQRLHEEGRAQGIQQGRQQARRDMLLELLRQRFGAAVDDIAERRVASASTEQLEQWTKRVLSVATLAELLGD